MSKLTPEQWKQVSPYLDEALTLSGDQRAEWLASFRQREPALAGLLQTLIDEHRDLAEEEFLDRRPATPSLSSVSEGQTIGAYRLISKIGQGGMGAVWLAERSDGRFERKVAVKFLGIALPGRTVEERFKREGSILGRLIHPHIAELIDAGVLSTGEPYLVLEYVDGEQIDRYCDERILDVESRVRLFLDVMDAVATAHNNLIVHRDVKPSNVLVSRDGKVKLLDFGIAKLLDGEGQVGATSILTQEGGSALTPAYAAPEQLTGGFITTATDVYSLGVLLYVLLTGLHPSGAGTNTPADLMRAIVETEPPRPSDAVTSTEESIANASSRAVSPEKLQRTLRGDLDTIVGKALKKNQQERYTSVAAMAEDLRRFLRHEPIRSRPDTIAYRTARFVRRHRITVALATLAAGATAVGIVGILFQARQARIQRDFALLMVNRAESLSEFDEFLLSNAAPSGKPFSVNELLRRAEQIVSRQHTGEEADRVESLISIGRQYSTQDDEESALRVLEEAYKLSRPLPESTIRAEASCTLAASLARTGEFERAEELYQEGIRAFPNKPQFALYRNFCLLRGSEVARERGDSEQGILRAQAAQLALKETPFRFDKRQLNTSMDLAESYRSAGQIRSAAAAFEEAAVRLSALGLDETQDAVVLYNGWAFSLSQLGRPVEAEKLYRHAIELSRADQSEGAVSPIVLNNYARTLRELGQLDRAADYAQRSYAKAQRDKLDVAVNQSLLMLALIYYDQGNIARANAMLTEVEPRLRRSLPPGHYAFAVLSSYKSLVALGSGDVKSAAMLSNEAVAIIEAAIKSGGQGTDYLPGMLIRRCTVELADGRPADAVTDASRAVSQLQQSVAPREYSSTLGHAYLIQSKALLAQGKLEESHAAARSAAEQLMKAVGADHPDTRAALELAGQASPAPPSRVLHQWNPNSLVVFAREISL